MFCVSYPTDNKGSKAFHYPKTRKHLNWYLRNGWKQEFPKKELAKMGWLWNVRLFGKTFQLINWRTWSHGYNPTKLVFGDYELRWW